MIDWRTVYHLWIASRCKHVTEKEKSGAAPSNSTLNLGGAGRQVYSPNLKLSLVDGWLQKCTFFLNCFARQTRHPKGKTSKSAGHANNTASGVHRWLADCESNTRKHQWYDRSNALDTRQTGRCRQPSSRKRNHHANSELGNKHHAKGTMQHISKWILDMVGGVNILHASPPIVQRWWISVMQTSSSATSVLIRMSTCVCAPNKKERYARDHVHARLLPVMHVQTAGSAFTTCRERGECALAFEN